MSTSKKWREAETVKFVKLYEEAECLWNYRHPAYKNRSAREKACKFIIDSMDMPEFGIGELKNKIKNIRSTYAQEVNKIKRSKAGLNGPDQDEYKTSLAWFSIANRFLGSVISTPASNTSKTLKSEVEKCEDNATNVSSGELHLSSLVKADMDEGCEFTEEPPDLYYPPITIDHIKTEVSSDDYIIPSKRRRVAYDVEHSDDIESVQEANEARDEFFYFGKNVSCQLRQLPLHRALLCQSKILELLMTQRVEALNEV